MSLVMPGFLFASAPAVFPSDYSAVESVRRLAAATSTSMFRTLTKQSAVGTVSPTRVSLQRYIPLLHNSFKPWFIGKFQKAGGGVVLTGEFRMHRAVQVFMVVWLGLAVVWTGAAAYAIVAGNRSDWGLPLAGIALIVFGVALALSGKWFARNDVAWLSSVINKALTNELR